MNTENPALQNIYQRNLIEAAILTTALSAMFWYKLELPVIWAYLLGINACTFALMAKDKSAAQKGALRIPEKILFVLVFAGGTPGILVSMHLFRHKIRKYSFQITALLITVAQGLIYLRIVAPMLGQN